MPSPRFKRIEHYTTEDLEAAIAEAISHCKEQDLDFWVIFKGFDAYNEKRRRRRALEGGTHTDAMKNSD